MLDLQNQATVWDTEIEKKEEDIHQKRFIHKALNVS